MKVLLREDVEKVGGRGEIVEVADGFARNFLLPRRLAVPATEANFRQLEMEKGRIGRLAAKERAEREADRARLEGTSVTVVAAASPEGHLYGSVGPREIADALTKEGVPVQEENVRLAEHIKEVGVYVVEVQMAPDLVAQTRVWVVSE